MVSPFTRYAVAPTGHRPSFIDAGPPEMAKASCARFTQLLAAELGRPVPTGVFGADMQVELQNDGPVTLWLERDAEP